jgi:CRP/FNR family transcriptional regulator
MQCAFGVFCLNKDEVKLISKHHHLKRKEILHSANDKFKNLYAIQYGALKTYETDAAGNEVIHGLYLKNEVYGYEAIHRGHHLFSVEALSETLVCEISYHAFLELLRSKPHLLERILYLMSQQLAFDAYLKLSTAQQRLGAFLLDLSARLFITDHKNTTELNFLLPVTYQDIGRYLGLATETVSRILSQFKKNKIIAINNKHIHLLQIDKLKGIAKGF